MNWLRRLFRKSDDIGIWQQKAKSWALTPGDGITPICYQDKSKAEPGELSGSIRCENKFPTKDDVPLLFVGYQIDECGREKTH